MREQYVKNKAEYSKNENEYRKYHQMLGYGKLANVIAFLFCVYSLFQYDIYFPFIAIAFALAGIYIVLAIVHYKVDIKIDESVGKQAILQQYIDRIDGEWGEFSDQGVEFIDNRHPYTRDLDIFGPNSLFQFLNTTKTWHGRQRFSQSLSQMGYNKAEIKKRQEAVWELTAHTHFTTDFQYHGEKLKKTSEILSLINLLKGNEKIEVNRIAGYLIYIPLFTSVFALFVVYREIEKFYIAAGIILGIQALIWLFGSIRANQVLGEVTSAGYKLDNYANLFDLIEAKTFECDKLIELKNTIASEGVKVSSAMKELKFVISKIDMRKNEVVYLILNLFLLWDYSCLYSLKAWRAKYQNQVEGWFEALGEMEEIMCFANLAFVDENICMPEITEDARVEAIELGHPLIVQKDRVNNSFKINNEIFIVSGSNMSGKTTFLRTIGINMVLGLNGGFCCAAALTLPNIKIISSMRVYDDLSKGVSTFYAELERIKRILEICRNEKAMFLIDEIFRGTNSDDRLYGAQSVIKTLEKMGVLGLITTHDLALCKTDGNKRIKNYSFSETYENGEIRFNYILNEGPAKSTNAKYLMEMLGIL